MFSKSYKSDEDMDKDFETLRQYHCNVPLHISIDGTLYITRLGRSRVQF